MSKGAREKLFSKNTLDRSAFLVDFSEALRYDFVIVLKKLFQDTTFKVKSTSESDIIDISKKI